MFTLRHTSVPTGRHPAGTGGARSRNRVPRVPSSVSRFQFLHWPAALIVLYSTCARPPSKRRSTSRKRSKCGTTIGRSSTCSMATPGSSGSLVHITLDQIESKYNKYEAGHLNRGSSRLGSREYSRLPKDQRNT